MAEVTYFVALPFIAADESVAPRSRSKLQSQRCHDACRGAVAQGGSCRRRRIQPDPFGLWRNNGTVALMRLTPRSDGGSL
jgi:hypothetical protein